MLASFPHRQSPRCHHNQRRIHVQPRRGSSKCQQLSVDTITTTEQRPASLREKFLNYHSQADTATGVLTITALQPHWVQRTAEIMTDSFAEGSPKLTAYRLFLRRQITQYVKEHMLLPPRCIILTAVLQPPPASTTSQDDGGGSSVSNATHSSIPSGIVQQTEVPPTTHQTDSVESSSSSTSGRADDIPMRDLPELRAFSSSSSDGSSSHVDGTGSTDYSTGSSTSVGNARGSHADDNIGSSAYSAGSGAGSNGHHMGSQADTPSSISGGANGSDDSLLSSRPHGGGLQPPAAAAASAATTNEPQGVLAGVVEVSFDSMTRTQYLTLNAPDRCGYLCNMAVDPQFRRRGYARLLIQAVEDLCLAAGQRELYLHLRFKDAAAAALYEGAGFVRHSEDPWIMSLFGYDRRYLMVKRLGPAAPGGR